MADLKQNSSPGRSEFSFETGSLLHTVGDGVPSIVSVQTPDTAIVSGSYALFTATGTVLCRVFAICDETLTESNGDETIEVGIVGNTALLLSQYATPLDFVVGDAWGSTTALPGSTVNDLVLIDDIDIDFTVAGSTGLGDGRFTFYCQWIPVSSGSSVVASSWA